MVIRANIWPDASIQGSSRLWFETTISCGHPLDGIAPYDSRLYIILVFGCWHPLPDHRHRRWDQCETLIGCWSVFLIVHARKVLPLLSGFPLTSREISIWFSPQTISRFLGVRNENAWKSDRIGPEYSYRSLSRGEWRPLSMMCSRCING